MLRVATCPGVLVLATACQGGGWRGWRGGGGLEGGRVLGCSWSP